MDWLDLFDINLSLADERTPLYRRIVDAISGAIESGKLKAGDKLPTNRELASKLKIDRSTASRAYDELSSRGLIKSHVGRGTFVESAAIKVTAPNPVSYAAMPVRSGAIDWQNRYSSYASELYSLMEKQPRLTQGGDVINFAAGIPARHSYPQEEFVDIMQELIKSSGESSLFEFSPASGEPALRAAVIKHLEKRQVIVRDSELMILSGSQQGIDLMSNLFLNTHDLVVTENPTYFWAISNFKARQADIVGCSLDDEGIRLDELESALMSGRVKFIYLMPSGQNPTGITMSFERRKAVLALARRFATPIFEDDFSGDLFYDGEPLPPLRAISADASEHVIYQGTFSKALAPGIRLGWLVAPPPVIERLNFAKRGADLSTNSMAQAMLTEFLRRGSYDRHLARINATYTLRRDAMLSALAQYFAGTGVTFTRPKGGLFLWLKLPDYMSARNLLTFAQRAGVSFSPGDLCYVSEPDASTIRLSFIQNDQDTIKEGVKRLYNAYKLYLAELEDKAPKQTYGATAEHVLI